MKTLKEVAKLLRVTDSNLRHRLRNKTIKAKKMAGSWFFEEKEVKELLKEKEEKALYRRFGEEYLANRKKTNEQN